MAATTHGRCWTGLTAALLLGFLAGTARADSSEEAQAAAGRVREALQSRGTPGLVAQIAAKDEAAAALAAQLAAHPDVVAVLAAEALPRAKALALRDGGQAEAFAAWLADVAEEAHRSHRDDPAATAAFRDALLLRGRVGAILRNPVDASVWTQAADLAVGASDCKGSTVRPLEAHVQALAILHGAEIAEGPALRKVMRHASRLCSRAVRQDGITEDVRRAIAGSYRKQAEALAATSRRGAQKALQGYFETFRPLVEGDRPPKPDVRAWNAQVTFARRLDVASDAEYIGLRLTGGDGLIAYVLPETGRWKSERGTIYQLFENEYLFRAISFQTYDWDTIYTMPGSARTVGGDNVKGVAGRGFDSFIQRREDEGGTILGTKKPRRGKLNKKLGAGIEYVIEYRNEEGNEYRMRSFCVKAVKAERTVKISILEPLGLTAEDPEFDGLITSMDITKKER